MTLRELYEITIDIKYNVIFCHGENFYEKSDYDWTEEELDNSELAVISEVDGITTFYFYI